jgi:hypothetical protein
MGGKFPKKSLDFRIFTWYDIQACEQDGPLPPPVQLDCGIPCAVRTSEKKGGQVKWI